MDNKAQPPSRRVLLANSQRAVSMRSLTDKQRVALRSSFRLPDTSNTSLISSKNQKKEDPQKQRRRSANSKRHDSMKAMVRENSAPSLLSREEEPQKQTRRSVKHDSMKNLLSIDQKQRRRSANSKTTNLKGRQGATSTRGSFMSRESLAPLMTPRDQREKTQTQLASSKRRDSKTSRKDQEKKSSRSSFLSRESLTPLLMDSKKPTRSQSDVQLGSTRHPTVAEGTKNWSVLTGGKRRASTTNLKGHQGESATRGSFMSRESLAPLMTASAQREGPPKQLASSKRRGSKGNLKDQERKSSRRGSSFMSRDSLMPLLVDSKKPMRSQSDVQLGSRRGPAVAEDTKNWSAPSGSQPRNSQSQRGTEHGNDDEEGLSKFHSRHRRIGTKPRGGNTADGIFWVKPREGASKSFKELKGKKKAKGRLTLRPKILTQAAY